MKIETDSQGLVIGIHPTTAEEITEKMLTKLVSLRPELSYILNQGPESIVEMENKELFSIKTAISIFAEAENAAQSQMASLINSWDISIATGYILDHLGTTFYGLERTKSEPSEATIILVCDRGASNGYSKGEPEDLKIPQGFTISISGRKFLTKYEQTFTHEFEEESQTLTLFGVRYITLKINKDDSTKVHARFDTDRVSHSTAETEPEKIGEGLLSQVQKFSSWASLSSKSIAPDDIVGGVIEEGGSHILSLGFDEPTDITIPNTNTNKLSVLMYGMEFECRELEDDIEGEIDAGTDVDEIDPNENKKLKLDGKTATGHIQKAFLWTNSTRIVQKETDEEYRERIKTTRTITAVGNAEAMRLQILKIPGVTHCYIINNPTDNDKKIEPPTDKADSVTTEEDVDAVRTVRDKTKVPKFTISPNSFCVFVEGGAPVAIANTIHHFTPVGIPSSGNRYVDTTAANGEKIKVRFARPVPHSISVLVSIQKKRSGIDHRNYPPAEIVVEAAIKDLIINAVSKLEIGELLCVQSLGDGFLVKMPWMGYRMIKVADKAGVRSATSEDFKEDNQLSIEPYEFISVARDDIIVHHIAVA